MQVSRPLILLENRKQADDPIFYMLPNPILPKGSVDSKRNLVGTAASSFMLSTLSPYHTRCL